MSRCYLDNDICPHCGITYKKFRCSISTFAEIKTEMYRPVKDTSKWRYKRRNSVLGYWHQLKKTEWQYHLEQCGYIHDIIETECVFVEY